ncbi:MAG: methyltransferase domain-containing protein [Pyrinomonadaceae bacterium]
MPADNPEATPAWDERDSQAFIDYGNYFVPEREKQIAIICELVGAGDERRRVLELCCGEGLLARALLTRFPRAIVTAYDGSPEMLQRAQQNLAAFAPRFEAQQFDLAAHDWRAGQREQFDAVVSSLAIHHLDGAEKQALFRAVYDMLTPGGVFVVADVFEPAHPRGQTVAARAWDDAVRQRALELDGNEAAFDFFTRDGWNLYRHPDPLDKPSRLLDQLQWLTAAGFTDVDVHWLKAGHAVYSGHKPC